MGKASTSRAILLALAVVAAALATYQPALRGRFLWDDDAYVTRPDLRSWAGLERIWTEVGATEQYYPVLHSAFWLEHRIWGDSELGYHLCNVLLHALCACLLAAVLMEAGRGGLVSRSVAWLAAFLFAVHPVCVESVAWISEQKNTLSTAFYLLAALLFLRWRRGRSGQAPGPSRGRPLYALAALCFLLALGSKTVTATLPAALLVVLWWRQGSLSWPEDVRPLVPWFVAGAAGGLFSGWVERTYVGAAGPEFALSLAQRGLIAGREIWFYLGKLLWPARLIFIYPRWTIDPREWLQWLPLLAAAAATLLLWRARGKAGRACLCAWLFFVGSLFPTLGFFNVYAFRYSFVADHWQYLPSLGMAALAAAGWGLLPRRPGLAAAAGLIALLAALSWRQCRDYRDPETFYRAILARNPGSWLAQNNLGNLLRAEGRRSEALAHYAAAVRANPESADVRCNYGIGLADAGRLPEALAQYRQSLRIDPDFPEAHYNLGIALARMGRLSEAIAEDRRAAALRPARPNFHLNLANALEQAGEYQAACGEYQAAIRLEPGYAPAHYNLGIALRRLGRYAEALAQFGLAERLEPGYPGVPLNRALALQAMGRGAEAIAEYRRAVAADPRDPEALTGLGVALARAGRPGEAVAAFRSAVELDPADPGAHHNLGLALQAAGRAREAEAEFGREQRLRSGAPAGGG